MGEDSGSSISGGNLLGVVGIPFGACIRPLGVLSAIEICFNGELICIGSLVFVFAAPLTGDERNATLYCDARGVLCR